MLYNELVNAKKKCLSGGIGRRTGLKILRDLTLVSVQVRPQAPNIILEEYPSLVEGTGLENRKVGNGAGVRIPFSPPKYRGIEQFGSSPGS